MQIPPGSSATMCSLYSHHGEIATGESGPEGNSPYGVADKPDEKSAQPPLDLPRHQLIAFSREVIVADDVEPFIPALVGLACREEHRKQVDEGLAALLAEIAPQRDLTAVAIALRDLLRPGIDDDGQRNVSRSQEIGELSHVLQRAPDAAID